MNTEITEYNKSLDFAKRQLENNLKMFFGFDVEEAVVQKVNKFPVGARIRINKNVALWNSDLIDGIVTELHSDDRSKKMCEDVKISSEQVYKARFDISEGSFPHSWVELIHYPIGSKLKVVGEKAKDFPVYNKVGIVELVSFEPDWGPYTKKDFHPNHVVYKLKFVGESWIITDHWCELTEE